MATNFDVNATMKELAMTNTKPDSQRLNREPSCTYLPLDPTVVVNQRNIVIDRVGKHLCDETNCRIDVREIRNCKPAAGIDVGCGNAKHSSK